MVYMSHEKNNLSLREVEWNANSASVCKWCDMIAEVRPGLRVTQFLRPTARFLPPARWTIREKSASAIELVRHSMGRTSRQSVLSLLVTLSFCNRLTRLQIPRLRFPRNRHQVECDAPERGQLCIRRGVELPRTFFYDRSFHAPL